jgi:aspartate kinase
VIKVLEFNDIFLKDARSIGDMKNIIASHHGEKLLLVVSAMATVNDMLKELNFSYMHQDADVHKLLGQVRKYHDDLLNQLIKDHGHAIYDEVANTFIEIDWMLEDEPHPDVNFNHDQIVSIGPMVSSKIIAAVLQENNLPVKWLDARSYIHTDNTYGAGVVDRIKTKRSVEALKHQDQIIITQGSVGGTSENFTTTLGPEGMDYSGALFASNLNADSLHIWYGVPENGSENRNARILKDSGVAIHVHQPGGN